MKAAHCNPYYFCCKVAIWSVCSHYYNSEESGIKNEILFREEAVGLSFSDLLTYQHSEVKSHFFFFLM